MAKVYDLIIIGAGPAGITASIYAARKKIDFLVLSMDIGGQTAWSGEIENYVGYQFISGIDLTAKFQDHMKKYGINLKEGEEVTLIGKEGEAFKVVSSGGEYASKAVIIASGKKSRPLGVPGEEEFRNKGLAYCATCDAPLFADKKVAVVGGGNSAVEAALQLMRIASHVHIINNTGSLGGDEMIRDKVLAAGNVTVMNKCEVTEVTGDVFVSGVKLKTPRGDESLDVEGVFVEVGLIPNSSFTHPAEMNDYGEIKVNPKNETNVPGIFAAGDVTDVPEKQIIVAAGEGAKASLTAFNYIARL